MVKLLIYNKIIRINIFVILFISIFIFGSVFRYLRIYNSDFNAIPYIIEIILFIAVFTKILIQRIKDFNNLDFLFLILLIYASLSFFVLSITRGKIL